MLGGFRLIMQDNGNLVLYEIDDMKLPPETLHVFDYTPDVKKLYAAPIWSTETMCPNKEKAPVRTAHGSDGNLVVYDKNQRPCFETRTVGNPGSFLRLQTDGNLVIYTPGLKVAWASNTAARLGHAPDPPRPALPRRRGNPEGRAFQARLSKDLASGMRLNIGDSLFSPLGGFRLVLQDDGNLVLYVIDDMRVPWDASLTVLHDPSVLGLYENVVWSAGTHALARGRPGRYCIMKENGNFVVCDEDDKPCLESGTGGHPGAFLRCQDDGNLVIYTRDYKPIWQSKTYARIEDVPKSK